LDVLQDVATRHFVERGFKERRVYKPPPKKYLLLYDDETGRYDKNGIITSFMKYTSCTLIIFKKSRIDRSFYERYKRILELPRGGGYWLWKPYIIHETLKRIEKNSLLFYMDSSYTCVGNLDRVWAYTDTNDIMVWKNKPNSTVYYMKEWCKMDVMRRYFDYDLHSQDEICWAGAMVLKKTSYVESIIDDWLQLCCSYENITDAESKEPNSSSFKEHRHDQSLLTIVLYRYMVPLHFLTNDFLLNNRDYFQNRKQVVQQRTNRWILHG